MAVTRAKVWPRTMAWPLWSQNHGVAIGPDPEVENKSKVIIGALCHAPGQAKLATTTMMISLLLRGIKRLLGFSREFQRS